MRDGAVVDAARGHELQVSMATGFVPARQSSTAAAVIHPGAASFGGSRVKIKKQVANGFCSTNNAVEAEHRGASGRWRGRARGIHEAPPKELSYQFEEAR